MSSQVWWLGKEVACMCDASVLEDSLSPLHGKFFALYSNTAAETLYPDNDTSCALWNLKSPLQMPEQVKCVCVCVCEPPQLYKEVPPGGLWTCMVDKGFLYPGCSFVSLL